MAVLHPPDFRLSPSAPEFLNRLRWGEKIVSAFHHQKITRRPPRRMGLKVQLLDRDSQALHAGPDMTTKLQRLDGPVDPRHRRHQNPMRQAGIDRGGQPSQPSPQRHPPESDGAVALPLQPADQGAYIGHGLPGRTHHVRQITREEIPNRAAPRFTRAMVGHLNHNRGHPAPSQAPGQKRKMAPVSIFAVPPVQQDHGRTVFPRIAPALVELPPHAIVAAGWGVQRGREMEGVARTEFHRSGRRLFPQPPEVKRGNLTHRGRRSGVSPHTSAGALNGNPIQTFGDPRRHTLNLPLNQRTLQAEGQISDFCACLNQRLAGFSFLRLRDTQRTRPKWWNGRHARFRIWCREA